VLAVYVIRDVVGVLAHDEDRRRPLTIDHDGAALRPFGLARRHVERKDRNAERWVVAVRALRFSGQKLFFDVHWINCSTTILKTIFKDGDSSSSETATHRN
jgi:hypothetical protein